MSTDDDSKDPKVKQLVEQSVASGQPLEELVDAVTAQQLQRWFGLPTFQQVDEGEANVGPTEDPDIAMVRERRAKAIAAVDPALLAAIHYHFRDDGLIKFKPEIRSTVDESIARLDMAMIENKMTIGEPRSYTRPEDIEDELRDNTPQAMLRDLHRPELEFEKTFESIDMAADQKIDIVAEVATAMATNWKLPPLGELPSVELARQIKAARDERKSPWRDIPTRVKLPNRRVTE